MIPTGSPQHSWLVASPLVPGQRGCAGWHREVHSVPRPRAALETMLGRGPALAQGVVSPLLVPCAWQDATGVRQVLGMTHGEMCGTFSLRLS